MGPRRTIGDFCRSLGGSLRESCTANWFCKLVLLAEHWRLLGAAAGDSGWPECAD